MKLKKRLFSLFPVISTLHQLSLASGKYGIYVFFQSRTRVFNLCFARASGSDQHFRETESNWISLSAARHAYLWASKACSLLHPWSRGEKTQYEVHPLAFNVFRGLNGCQKETIKPGRYSLIWSVRGRTAKQYMVLLASVVNRVRSCPITSREKFC